MFELFEKLPKEKQLSILSSGIKEFSKKSYSEVSTDTITKNCGISKGILFHYFGSKKMFYEYCLTESLKKLVSLPPSPKGEDFYSIIFASMDEKIRLCLEYSDETKLVNMASRDASLDAAEVSRRLFAQYYAKKGAESMAVISHALASLPLKEPDNKMVLNGVLLYCNAVMQKYLLQYQNCPLEFFEKADEIKLSIKEHLDLILYGIIDEQHGGHV